MNFLIFFFALSVLILGAVAAVVAVGAVVDVIAVVILLFLSAFVKF